MKEGKVNGSTYQTQQEPLGNQASREMSKNVHRRTVGVTALMAQSLNLVIGNAITSGYCTCSSPNTEAMTGEIFRNACS